VTCRVSTDQSVKMAEDGGREVLLEVGRHAATAAEAALGRAGVSAVPSSVVTVTPSQSSITRGPGRSREMPHPLAKLMIFREPDGEPTEADARRRPATSGD
jgi:hypothetical protein